MPFQRASEEKLRTRRIVSVGGRFRRAAAASPEPADETSRSPSTGTGQPPYQPTRDQELVYHSITTNPAYRAKSFEELRLEDYEQGNKGRGGAAPATELGSSPTTTMPRLSRELRAQGWSVQQSRGSGEWYYVHTSNFNGRTRTQWEHPGGSPAPVARAVEPVVAEPVADEGPPPATALTVRGTRAIQRRAASPDGPDIATLFRALLHVGTYGIVDINPRTGLIIRDPIRGVVDALSRAESSQRDFAEGVWIGKRPLKEFPIQIRIPFFNLGNKEVAHAAVRVSGTTISLEALSTRHTTPNVAATPRGAGLEWRVTHDDDTYEWTYVGAYARSESASSYLENKIRYLNRQKYDMFNENCQYYSKAVAGECIRDEDRGNLAVV